MLGRQNVPILKLDSTFAGVNLFLLTLLESVAVNFIEFVANVVSVGSLLEEDEIVIECQQIYCLKCTKKFVPHNVIIIFNLVVLRWI